MSIPLQASVLQVNFDMGSSQCRCELRLVTDRGHPGSDWRPLPSQPRAPEQRWLTPTVLSVRTEGKLHAVEDVEVGWKALGLRRDFPTKYILFEHIKLAFVRGPVAPSIQAVIDEQKRLCGRLGTDMHCIVRKFFERVLADIWGSMKAEVINVYINTCGSWTAWSNRQLVDAVKDAGTIFGRCQVEAITESVAALIGATSGEVERSCGDDMIVIDFGHMEMNIIHARPARDAGHWDLVSYVDDVDCGACCLNSTASQEYNRARAPTSPSMTEMFTLYRFVEDTFKPNRDQDKYESLLEPESFATAVAALKAERCSWSERCVRRIRNFVSCGDIESATVLITGGAAASTTLREVLEAMDAASPGLRLQWEDVVRDKRNDTSAVLRGMRCIRESPQLVQPVQTPLDAWFLSDAMRERAEKLEPAAASGDRMLLLFPSGRELIAGPGAGHVRSLPAQRYSLTAPRGERLRLDLSVYTTPNSTTADQVRATRRGPDPRIYACRSKLKLLDEYTAVLNCDRSRADCLLFPTFHYFAMSLVVVYAEDGRRLRDWENKHLTELCDLNTRSMRQGYSSYKGVTVKLVVLEVVPPKVQRQSEPVYTQESIITEPVGIEESITVATRAGVVGTQSSALDAGGNAAIDASARAKDSTHRKRKRGTESPLVSHTMDHATAMISGTASSVTSEHPKGPLHTLRHKIQRVLLRNPTLPPGQEYDIPGDDALRKVDGYFQELEQLQRGPSMIADMRAAKVSRLLESVEKTTDIPGDKLYGFARRSGILLNQLGLRRPIRTSRAGGVGGGWAAPTATTGDTGNDVDRSIDRAIVSTTTHITVDTESLSSAAPTAPGGAAELVSVRSDQARRISPKYDSHRSASGDRDATEFVGPPWVRNSCWMDAVLWLIKYFGTPVTEAAVNDSVLESDSSTLATCLTDVLSLDWKVPQLETLGRARDRLQDVYCESQGIVTGVFSSPVRFWESVAPYLLSACYMAATETRCVGHDSIGEDRCSFRNVTHARQRSVLPSCFDILELSGQITPSVKETDRTLDDYVAAAFAWLKSDRTCERCGSRLRKRYVVDGPLPQLLVLGESPGTLLQPTARTDILTGCIGLKFFNTESVECKAIYRNVGLIFLHQHHFIAVKCRPDSDKVFLYDDRSGTRLFSMADEHLRHGDTCFSMALYERVTS